MKEGKEKRRVKQKERMNVKKAKKTEEVKKGQTGRKRFQGCCFFDFTPSVPPKYF